MATCLLQIPSPSQLRTPRPPEVQFFSMTGKNSASLISPSPSSSASARISFNSASDKFSPSSLGSLEVLERDFASVVIVKKLEALHHLLLAILLVHLFGHHDAELLKVHSRITILVHLLHHLGDLFLLGLESKSLHRCVELSCVHSTGSVCVKQVERFPQFALLLWGEVLQFRGPLVCCSTSSCHVFYPPC